jgi:hypothetical protein
MKHIKLREDFSVGEKMLGKIFKIYPTRNPDKMIVIAKLVEVIGVNKTWGNFEGVIIHPESRLGERWEDNEMLSDWMNLFPDYEELKIYNYYTKSDKYNL